MNRERNSIHSRQCDRPLSPSPAFDLMAFSVLAAALLLLPLAYSINIQFSFSNLKFSRSKKCLQSLLFYPQPAREAKQRKKHIKFVVSCVYIILLLFLHSPSSANIYLSFINNTERACEFFFLIARHVGGRRIVCSITFCARRTEPKATTTTCPRNIY